jgi:hypothetical protein
MAALVQAELLIRHTVEPHPTGGRRGRRAVRDWSFRTWATMAFVLNGVCLAALLVNALTGNRFSDVLLPLAVATLIAGGAVLFRVRLLWFRRSRGSAGPRR